MTKKRNITSRLNKVDYLIFSICSVLAIAMLFLFFKEANSILVKQNEIPVAIISMKENKVQRKLIDHNVYEKVRLNTDIYDGDILRTEENSTTVAKFFSDDSSIELGENSIIQIFQNKKKSSIDFIGGEIEIKNNSDDNSFVIHAGLKEIEIKKKAEVKITVINHPMEKTSDAVQEQSEKSGLLPDDGINEVMPFEAVIDVVSGEVEIAETDVTPSIKNQKEKKSEKNKNKKNEKQTVSAGSQVTLDLSKPLSEEVVSVEIADSSNKDNSIAQADESKNSEDEVLQVPSDEKNKAEEKTNAVSSDDADVPAKEVIEVNSSQTVFFPSKRFASNIYDESKGSRNYQFALKLSSVLPEQKRIPKGAAIEFTFSGVPDQKLQLLTLQVSTGKKMWQRAHKFRWISINQFEGVEPGDSFKIKQVVLLDEMIINTSTSDLVFSYNPEILDCETEISNFSISAKILDLEAGSKITSPAAGYTKTIECEEIALLREDYENKTSSNVFFINAEDLFGTLKKLPTGTKLNFTISGESSVPLQWMNISLSYTDFDGNWITALNSGTMGDSGNIVKNAGGTGKNFKYSYNFTINRNIPDTSVATIKFYSDGKIKPAPEISNFKLTVEVL